MADTGWDLGREIALTTTPGMLLALAQRGRMEAVFREQTMKLPGRARCGQLGRVRKVTAAQCINVIYLHADSASLKSKGQA